MGEDAQSLDKEMSGKGTAEQFPKGKKKLDAEVPEVKKKDDAQYKAAVKDE